MLSNLKLGYRARGGVLACNILVFVIAPLAKGQTSLAGVNERTPPEQVAKTVWDTIFTKCGASYYFTEYLADDFGDGSKELTLVEYKDPHPATLENVPLSAADRANGYRYESVTRVQADLHRWRSNSPKHQQWTPWFDGGRLSIRMTELNGKWIFEDLSQGADVLLHSYSPGLSIETDLSEYTKQKLSCAVAASDHPLAAYPHLTAQDLAVQDAKRRLEQSRQQNGSPNPIDAETTSYVGKFICPGALLRDHSRKDYQVDRPRRILHMVTLGKVVFVGFDDDQKDGRSAANLYFLIEGQPQNSCPAR